MLSSDLPIAKLEEDELNRGSFAESLAKTFILIVERGPVESSLKDCIAEDAIMKALDQMGSKIETDDTKRD